MSGGKITLLDGTYSISQKITCNKNVVFEGMGNGTEIKCTSHVFLYNSTAGYKITLRDISFNLTNGLNAGNYFIQCANSNLLIDNCKILAVTSSASDDTADYIKTPGNLTISNSDITIDLRCKMNCVAFVGDRADGKKLLIDGCAIDMCNCTNGAYGSFAVSQGNLYILRNGGIISNCNIVCSGTKSGSVEYLSCAARMSADIVNCKINLKNSYTSINTNDWVTGSEGKLTGNTISCYGSYINVLLCSGNIIKKKSSDKLVFRASYTVVSGNRFINYTQNDIEARSDVIFTNNTLKYSCSVSSSSSSLISNNKTSSSLS